MSLILRIHKRVKVEEVKGLLLIKQLRIYDLRDEESFTQGHMERAVCLSWTDLERVVLGSPKEIPILIYCYHGNLSQIAAQTFQDFGFREVYDLVGGTKVGMINRVAHLKRKHPRPIIPEGKTSGSGLNRSVLRLLSDLMWLIKAKPLNPKVA